MSALVSLECLVATEQHKPEICGMVPFAQGDLLRAVLMEITVAQGDSVSNRLISVAVTTFILAASGSAFAADMPVKAPPRSVPPVSSPSWTGFYAGINGGYAWTDRSFNFAGNDTVSQGLTCGPGGGAIGTCAPASFAMHGGVGGGQAGYNWQFNRNWLLGIEADFDWSDLRGQGASNFIFGGVSPIDIFRASENVQWFGTLRARLGFVSFDNWLIYATGGFAYGRVKDAAAFDLPGVFFGGNGIFGFDCRGSPTSSNCFIGSSSRTAAGFTIGGGMEFALWNNVSIRAEYLYVNLGHGSTFNAVAQGTPIPTESLSSFTVTSSHIDFNVVRVGLNYRFH